MPIDKRFRALVRRIYRENLERIDELKNALLSDPELKGLTPEQAEEIVNHRVRMCASVLSHHRGHYETIIESYLPSREDDNYNENYSIVKKIAKNFWEKIKD